MYNQIKRYIGKERSTSTFSSLVCDATLWLGVTISKSEVAVVLIQARSNLFVWLRTVETISDLLMKRH